MNIVNVGYNCRHSSDFCINRPCGSGDYLLLLLKSSAFVIIDGKKHIAKANSIIIFKKGTPQIYGATEEEFANDWIRFEFENENEKINEKELPFDSILKIEDSETISELIKNIFFERFSKNLYKKETSGLYFNLILYKIKENLNASKPQKENHWYETFTELKNDIYINPKKDWQIDFVCKKMHLSRSYVQHLYKEFFGNSIQDDITNSRIQYAKYLLSGTEMTVNSISEDCGYKNNVHFMRIFKKKTGITPTQYRVKKHC